ncbi:short chain dehydrogenase reductase family protein, putative [Ichthyophthirius multifiliis]|uniref:Short chain dehydrogenase reductase family protein, putative n=1 Tax=Ichthyophthirius multifiliis TaxID=5932 RepID=G0QZX6_ICHMU|nr:short chain dehydrogenase reductase family protein, putative [Ichthyophthirius multifiliis]EGR29238.1 short chain dehydrogenase reductase family protein, putative [Ichthyophthirius multifiliis]|eukprot:XP_004030474.1 short chain dehydrogenase reductase family protein, putative [Ichthyophthirius multifiliis]
MQNHFSQFSQEFDIFELDISIDESVKSFMNKIQEKYKYIDVLINNAGVVDRRPTNSNIANFTFQTNFLKTVELTENIFHNMLSNDGKILLISSILGQLEHQTLEGRKILENQNITKDYLFQLAEDYIKNSDFPQKLIFYQQSYHTSKAFLNAYGRFILTKQLKNQQSLYIIHPGWVKTDMGGQQAEITLDEACPYICDIACEFPFNRSVLNGKLIYKNKEIDF